MKTPNLKLRRTSPNSWVLTDTISGLDVGGIAYAHAADGCHYRASIFVNGALRDFGAPLPQLAMAAQAVAEATLR